MFDILCKLEIAVGNNLCCNFKFHTPLCLPYGVRKEERGCVASLKQPIRTPQFLAYVVTIKMSKNNHFIGLAAKLLDL